MPRFSWVSSSASDTPPCHCGIGDERGEFRIVLLAFSASGCSPATLMVTPISVSGGWVNTVSGSLRRIDRELDLQALGRPIQLRCMVLTESGQPGSLSSSSKQFLRVVGDAQEPLQDLALLDQRAGAPAAAVDHLLVGQARSGRPDPQFTTDAVLAMRRRLRGRTNMRCSCT